MHKVRVDIELSDTDLDCLVGDAIRFGFMRVEPRKAWSAVEKKEAARSAIADIVALHIASKG